MKLSCNVAVICLFAALASGCGDKKSPPAKKTDEARGEGRKEKEETPQFGVQVVQLHPDGTYWKQDLGKNALNESPIKGVSVKFLPTKMRKFPLNLKVSFIAHEDGFDIYEVTRTIRPPANKNEENFGQWQEQFGGKTILVFDDQYGKTLLIPRKTEELR